MSKEYINQPNDLKPCPFCNGVAEAMVGKNTNGNLYCYIKCIKCGARTDAIVESLSYSAVEVAAIQWNKRDSQ